MNSFHLLCWLCEHMANVCRSYFIWHHVHAFISWILFKCMSTNTFQAAGVKYRDFLNVRPSAMTNVEYVSKMKLYDRKVYCSRLFLLSRFKCLFMPFNHVHFKHTYIWHKFVKKKWFVAGVFFATCVKVFLSSNWFIWLRCVYM